MSHFFSQTLGWNITWTCFHAFYPSPSEVTFSSSNVPFLVDMKEERPVHEVTENYRENRMHRICCKCEAFEKWHSTSTNNTPGSVIVLFLFGNVFLLFSCACSAEREGRTLRFYSELWTALSFSLLTFTLPFFSTKIALIKDNKALKEIVLNPLTLQKSWIQYVHYFLIQHQIYCV